MTIRAVLLLVLIVATSRAADKTRVWQTGNISSVEVTSIEDTPNAFDNMPELVGPAHPGLPQTTSDQAPAGPHRDQRPPYATIRVTILSDTGTYVVKRSTALLSKPRPNSAGKIDPASIAPWVKELPATINFLSTAEPCTTWIQRAKSVRRRY